MGFIRSLVADAHAAEDIFQEVWLRLARAAERDEEIEDQGKWCRGVAKNLVLHYWRDQRNERVVADSRIVDRLEQAFDEDPRTADYWIERADALRQCIGTLPEKSRFLLQLRYEGGHSIEAITRAVGQTSAAVLKGLSRIRLALSECAERRLRSQSYT